MTDPRNLDVLSKAPSLMDKTIILKVVESHGCNSNHKVGDKFYFDVGLECGGWGRIVLELSVEKTKEN
jgi:hypothetical protein